MNDTLRKIIVASPMAACAIMLAWYWLGGVDRPQREPEQGLTAAAAVAEDAPARAGTDAGAASFRGWLSYQGELDAEQGVHGTAAPLADMSADTAVPEPLYSPDDSQLPVEERISETSQRATRGPTPQVRAAALAELAVIGNATVLNTMGEALADTELQVRLAAVKAAQRLAQYHGDEGGEILTWLTQVGNDADGQVALLAHAAANELAQDRGEEQPFP